MVELSNEYAGAAAGYYQLIMRSWIILCHGFMGQKDGLVIGSTNFHGLYFFDFLLLKLHLSI